MKNVGQGTTPDLTFTLPFDTSMISTGYISFRQTNDYGNHIQLDKSLDDCILEGQQVLVSLSQDETFDFEEDVPLEAQFRVMLTDGKVKKSKKIPLGKVSEAFYKEVIL